VPTEGASGRSARERAAGAQDGDLDMRPVDRSPGIVMFAVALPNEGVRGIEAYGDTWPPFFQPRSGE
jgi:hypothetical protein